MNKLVSKERKKYLKENARKKVLIIITQFFLLIGFLLLWEWLANKNIIDRLSIDIIKRIDGEYEVRELMGKLVNLYFNKMIIDITAIKNYRNPNIFEELRQYIDPSKVIILLNSDSIVNSKDYISSMIKAGFYNFSRNFEGINYLYNTPNDFSKVKHFIDDENVEVIPYIDTNAIVEQPSLAFAGKK